MTSNPYRITLDALREENSSAEEQVVRLSAELAAAQARLDHIRGAIQNIEALLGDTQDDEAQRGEEQRVMPTTTGGAHPFTISEYTAQPRKRIPSTEWAAEAVAALGRPADRDTIFAKFEELKGIPESWVAPRNSLNNALGRAVERNLIRKLGDNLFAPRDYEPASSSNEGGR